MDSATPVRFRAAPLSQRWTEGGLGCIPGPLFSCPVVPAAPPGPGAPRRGASLARASNRRFDGAREMRPGSSVRFAGNRIEERRRRPQINPGGASESTVDRGRTRVHPGAALFMSSRSRGAARTRRAAGARRSIRAAPLARPIAPRHGSATRKRGPRWTSPGALSRRWIECRAWVERPPVPRVWSRGPIRRRVRPPGSRESRRQTGRRCSRERSG